MQPALALDEPARPVAPTAPVIAIQPVVKIVDPSVAAHDEPLFAPPLYDDRKPKGGWLSLFGGRRPESPAPGAPPRSMGGAQPVLETFEDEEAAGREDLEIPSFLRRLAN